MKKYLLVITVLALLASCGGKKAESDTPVVVEEDDIVVTEIPSDIRELLIIVPEMGEVIEEQYSGIIPSDHTASISYLLTLYYQQGGDGGVYGLATTTQEMDEKDNTSTYSYGKREVISGAPFDANAIIYKLIPATGESPIYFLANEEGLTKLDDQMKPHNSSLNYTLAPIL